MNIKTELLCRLRNCVWIWHISFDAYIRFWLSCMRMYEVWLWVMQDLKETYSTKLKSWHPVPVRRFFVHRPWCPPWRRRSHVVAPKALRAATSEPGDWTQWSSTILESNGKKYDMAVCWDLLVYWIICFMNMMFIFILVFSVALFLAWVDSVMFQHSFHPFHLHSQSKTIAHRPSRSGLSYQLLLFLKCVMPYINSAAISLLGLVSTRNPPALRRHIHAT